MSMIKNLKKILKRKTKLKKSIFFMICATFFLGFVTCKSMYAFYNAPKNNDIFEHTLIDRYNLKKEDGINYWNSVTVGDLFYSWVGVLFFILAIRKS